MKHGGLERANTNVSWESLLWTANNDFLCVLVLWYCGMGVGSTYAWMLPHTVEKYLKSYLLKTNNINRDELKKFGKSGHSLIKIWEKYKAISTTKTIYPGLNKSFDEIVNDLDSIQSDTRYTGFIPLQSSDKLLYLYILLCSLMRYLILGKQKYRSSFYGIDNSHMLPMNYEPMCIGYGRVIVQKMLHLTLEHAASLTNLGLVNFWDDNYFISNTAIFTKMKDCPICSESRIDRLSLIKFYRDLAPVPIDPCSNH